MTLRTRLTATAASVALSVMLPSMIISFKFTTGVLFVHVISPVKKLWSRCAGESTNLDT